MLNVLTGNIGLGTVSGDPHRSSSGIHSRIQILNRPDSRYQQHRHLGPADRPRYRANPFHIGVRTNSIVEARSGQPIAVSDLEGVDTGIVERLGYPRHLLERITMPDGVHSIAQRNVLDVEFRHDQLLFCSARRSPVLSAADVMISRLPA